MVQQGGQYDQNAYAMPGANAPMQRAPGDPYGMAPTQPNVCYFAYLSVLGFFIVGNAWGEN